MRLEIFKHLLPNDLDFKTNWHPVPGRDLRMLMYTSKRISEEATELLFQNAVIHFKIRHSDFGGQRGKEVATLRGLNCTWRTTEKLHCAKLEDRLNEFKHKGLQEYLKYVRNIDIRIGSHSVYSNCVSLNKWYCGDSLYYADVDFLVSALNTCQSMKKVTVRIETRPSYLEKVEFQENSIRLQSLLSPFQALTGVELEIQFVRHHHMTWPEVLPEPREAFLMEYLQKLKVEASKPREDT